MADVGRKAIAQVKRAAETLLTDRMSADRAEALAEKLATGTWTHDYPISAAEAKELGLPVSTEMLKEVLEMMTLYPQPTRSHAGGVASGRRMAQTTRLDPDYDLARSARSRPDRHSHLQLCPHHRGLEDEGRGSPAARRRMDGPAARERRQGTRDALPSRARRLVADTVAIESGKAPPLPAPELDVAMADAGRSGAAMPVGSPYKISGQGAFPSRRPPHALVRARVRG
jgi:hypothetical protein